MATTGKKAAAGPSRPHRPRPSLAPPPARLPQVPPLSGLFSSPPPHQPLPGPLLQPASRKPSPSRVFPPARPHRPRPSPAPSSSPHPQDLPGGPSTLRSWLKSAFCVKGFSLWNHKVRHALRPPPSAVATAWLGKEGRLVAGAPLPGQGAGGGAQGGGTHRGWGACGRC